MTGNDGITSADSIDRRRERITQLRRARPGISVGRLSIILREEGFEKASTSTVRRDIDAIADALGDFSTHIDRAKDDIAVLQKLFDNAVLSGADDAIIARYARELRLYRMSYLSFDLRRHELIAIEQAQGLEGIAQKRLAELGIENSQDAKLVVAEVAKDFASDTFFDDVALNSHKTDAIQEEVLHEIQHG